MQPSEKAAAGGHGWRCRCGHSSLDHNAWWDVGGVESNGGPSSGAGCDHCDCDDAQPPYDWED